MINVLKLQITKLEIYRLKTEYTRPNQFGIIAPEALNP
jgi:hypothetical protein